MDQADRKLIHTTMKKNARALKLFCFFVMVSPAIGLPVGLHTEPRTDEDGQQFATQLTKLKMLLEKLERHNFGHGETTNLKVTPTTVGSHIDMEVGKIGNGIEPMARIADTSDNNSNNSDRIINMKKFAESISLKELLQLKALKALLDQAKEEIENAAHVDGTFPEKLADQTKDDKSDEKDDLSGLTKDGRIQLYLQKNKQSDEKKNRIQTQADEGSFGTFKDEIKTSVEKNLLSDIALAMHSGITIDEILKDLVETDDTETAANVWERD